MLPVYVCVPVSVCHSVWACVFVYVCVRSLCHDSFERVAFTEAATGNCSDASP